MRVKFYNPDYDVCVSVQNLKKMNVYRKGTYHKGSRSYNFDETIIEIITKNGTFHANVPSYYEDEFSNIENNLLHSGYVDLSKLQFERN